MGDMAAEMAVALTGPGCWCQTSSFLPGTHRGYCTADTWSDASRRTSLVAVHTHRQTNAGINWKRSEISKLCRASCCHLANTTESQFTPYLLIELYRNPAPAEIWLYRSNQNMTGFPDLEKTQFLCNSRLIWSRSSCSKHTNMK